MPESVSTLKEYGVEDCDRDGTAQLHPGLVLLFSCGRPLATVIRLGNNVIELGRGTHGLPPDPRMSRQHARVSFDGSRFLVTDLGSQNGTSCDGRRIRPYQPVEIDRVLRMGDSLLCVLRDVQPMAEKGILVEGGLLLGPSLQSLLAEVKQAASFADTLHIRGESGTGKELIAHTFHEHGPRPDGNFVGVNCAAIPQELAERLLFGACRGVYPSTGESTEGYIQAAAGGTLFLDDVGKLDLEVQAKLLRVLETKELLPLGASRPTTIELKVCSASSRDLKNQVAAGAFREDLYYRLGRPAVTIPPLRKRPEEVPWLIESIVRKNNASAGLHSSLIETCLLRPWPGNIRELLVEIRSAAQAAKTQGSLQVDARHLPDGAGSALSSSQPPPGPELMAVTPRPPPPLDPVEQRRIEAALHANQGNVSATARALGVHRTQLRRLLVRYGLEPRRYGDRQAPDSD